MPRLICKFTDNNESWYLEWSTVVDAPITFGMSLEDYKSYYKDEYGNQGMSDLESRLQRVENKGTSSMIYKSLDDLIGYNRAGRNETVLSKQQLIDVYCTRTILEKERPIGKKLDD